MLLQLAATQAGSSETSHAVDPSLPPFRNWGANIAVYFRLCVKRQLGMEILQNLPLAGVEPYGSKDFHEFAQVAALLD